MAADKKIQIKIEGNTTSFINSMKGAENATKRFRAETDKLGSNTSNTLHKFFQRAATNTAILQGPLNGISGRLSSLTTALGRNSLAWVGIGGALAIATAGMAKAVKVASEVEHQMLRLEGVFAATGGAAGQSLKGMDTFARSLALNTLTSSGAVREAGAALATFSSVSGDTFKRTLRASQDLSELFGGDLRGNAVRLGRALDDPINGLKALRRSGVSFTDSQREMIKSLAESGKYLEAQAALLAVVEGQVSGTAEKVASDSVVGAWDTFGQSMEEFFEAIASKLHLLDAMKVGLNKLAGAVTGLTQSLDPSTVPVEEYYAKLAKVESEIIEFEARNSKGHGYRNALKRREKLLKEWEGRQKDSIIEGIADEEGYNKSIITQQEKASEQRRKRAEDDAKIIEKFRRQREQNERSGAGAQDALTGENARYQTLVEQYQREFDALSTHQKSNEQIQFEHQMRLEAAHEAHLDRINKISEKMTKDHNKEQDQIEKERAKFDKKEFDKFVAIEDAKEDIRENALDMAEQGFASMAAMAADGSKAQRLLLLTEKSIALGRAMVNMQLAISAANTLPPPMKYLEIANAVAYGTQAIAGIQAVAMTARASGGAVMPGNKYWVGEHGPEVVSFGSPGMVTKNEDLTPSINVNIIEDASRAGTVEPSNEGETMNIFVAAAMGKLNEDFNSGRGLFSAMENKYGLTRR